MATGGTVDPLQYCAAVAQAMGVKVTPYTVAALKSLADGEGQWTAGGSWNYTADFNPFNISGGQPVLTEYAKEANGGVRATEPPGNGPPVDEFTSWQTGIQATADFIKNADPGIFSALQSIAANPTSTNVQQFFNAAGSSGSFGSSASGRVSFFNGNLQAAQSSGASLPNLDLASYTPPTPGTQTQVPGAAANTTSASAAPQDVPAGPASVESITGTGAAIPKLSDNATWPQTEAYIRKNYPTYSWLLNLKGPDSPASIIQQAVEGGWDSTRLQAGISQTKWWKDTSSSVQQWQQNTATHPGEYDFNTKGSTAQQTLGMITDAAKSVGAQLNDAEAKNLATEAMMYGWNATQVKENIGSVIASGASQQYSTSYLSGVEANPGQYAVGGQGQPTGPIAASAITQVRNAIASQGYNAKDFPDEDVNNLATEYMKFGWTSQQLAAAVIKVGAGGTAFQLSPQYTQGLITNPEQYQINGKNGTGPVAAQALTAVRNAIAAAGKTIGGKGGITAQQVQELAQESMMFGWNGQQLTQNINSLGKGGGLLSQSYLQGLITNAQEYQPGGTQYQAAASAVKAAVAGAGKTLSQQAQDALTQAYMEKGWDQSQLVQAIGTAGGGAGYTSQYLTGAQANPEQYQPGGTVYTQAQNDVLAAVRNQGVTGLTQDDMNNLIEGVMQQGWDSATLSNEIGAMKGGTAVNPQYLTGVAANPREYQFTNPSKNKGVQTTADQVLTQVEIVAGNQGVNLRPAQAQQIALEAMKSGGNSPSDAIIQSMLGKYVSVTPGQTAQGANPLATPANLDVTKQQGDLTQQGGTVGAIQGNPGLGAATNAPALLQQLRTQSTNYLISPPDNVLQQWARQIASGTQTMQSFEAYLAQQAGEKYPGMAQQIQQGQTPTQVAGGLTTLASQLLEIQPDQVNYLSPQFQKLLTGGFNEQGSGQNTTKIPNNSLMTQTQAGDYLRGLPQYQYTTNAKTSAANVETAILSAFGRVG